MEAMRAAEAETSAATRELRVIRATMPPMAQRRFGSIGEGPRNEPLVLQLAPWNDLDRKRTVTVQRLTDMKYDVQGQRQREKRPAPIAELKRGVLYVDLTRMKEADWVAALPRLTTAPGLILDIRGPLTFSSFLGNLTREPLWSERWFVPTITHPDRSRWEYDDTLRWSIPPAEPFLQAQKTFLIDGRIISSVEGVAAMVEHYRIADLVGENTGGTNGNVNRIMLPGGYIIPWTGMKVLKHDGSRHHGVGVKPTVPVSRTLAGVAAGRDEVLDRAVELLVPPPAPIA
jgi:C-terminal processing protease CtpA/Prc